MRVFEQSIKTFLHKDRKEAIAIGKRIRNMINNTNLNEEIDEDKTNFVFK